MRLGDYMMQLGTDPGDYQAKMLSAYYAQVPKLQAENRKLKKTIAFLLIVGTLQWVLQWF